MALGSLLLQPQALSRLQQVDSAQSLLDDAAATLHGVLFDPARASTLLPMLSSCFDELGARLRTRLESRLERAAGELRAMLEAATGGLDALAERVRGIEDAGDAFSFVSFVLERVAAAVELCTEPELRALLRRFHSLLGETLGLSPELLIEELRTVFRTLRERLIASAAVLAPAAAAAWHAFASLLARLEAEVFSNLPSFDLDPDRLAQTLFSSLQRGGIERVREQISTLLERLRAVLDTGHAVATLAQPSSFGPGSGGAASPRSPLSDSEYAWYASWLYADRRRSFPSSDGVDPGDFVGEMAKWLFGWTLLPGVPGDEVWLTSDKKQVVLRRVFAGDELLHEVETGTLRWFDAPQFTGTAEEHFSFRAGPEAMETLTHVLNSLSEFAQGIVHIVFFATQTKEYGANIPLWLWKWTQSATMGLGKAPLGSLVANNAGWPVFGGWLFAWVPALSVLFGSIEGRHSKTDAGNQIAYWLTLLASDAFSALKVSIGADLVRDLLLEIVTLINYDGPGGPPDGSDTRPRNFEYSDSMISAWGLLTDWLFMRHILPRDDHSLPFKHAKFCLWWLLGAPLSGVTAAILGTFTGWTFARTHDWGQFGKNIGTSAARSFLMYTIGISQYLGKDGDTDGGKYNPAQNENGTAYTPARRPFQGYPAKDTSPYKLPWEEGSAKFLGQANLGLFNHNRLDPTQPVYAFDFGLDFGDEVLAARGGTVVDFFDFIPDNIDPNPQQLTDAFNTSKGIMQNATDPDWRSGAPSWNVIIIRHDTSEPDHDKGENGSPVTTFAIYGHGKAGSIRAAFNARGVAPRNIIGSVVTQGQVIMQAGDTGMSFHNHTHLEVRTGSSLDPATSYTIPIVFREAGALDKLTWYTSANTKVT